eukprot:1538689-Pleurochrysis_carterae.AAC.1
MGEGRGGGGADDGEVDDCALGLVEIVSLALVAKADAAWTLPIALRRQAVRSALRLQKRRRTEAWLGWLARPLKPEDERELESGAGRERGAGGGAGGGGGAGASDVRAGVVGSVSACAPMRVRDALRCGLAAFGGNRARGKWGKVEGDRSAMAMEA